MRRHPSEDCMCSLCNPPDPLRIKKLFGGDAAEQRARQWAKEHGGKVEALENVAADVCDDAGLDAFYRDSDGTQYSHAVVQ